MSGGNIGGNVVTTKGSEDLRKGTSTFKVLQMGPETLLKEFYGIDKCPDCNAEMQWECDP